MYIKIQNLFFYFNLETLYENFRFKRRKNTYPSETTLFKKIDELCCFMRSIISYHFYMSGKFNLRENIFDAQR